MEPSCPRGWPAGQSWQPRDRVEAGLITLLAVLDTRGLAVPNRSHFPAVPLIPYNDHSFPGTTVHSRSAVHRKFERAAEGVSLGRRDRLSSWALPWQNALPVSSRQPERVGYADEACATAELRGSSPLLGRQGRRCGAVANEQRRSERWLGCSWLLRPALPRRRAIRYAGGAGAAWAHDIRR